MSTRENRQDEVLAPWDLDLKVINFHGGPGSGKSTTSAGLYNLMKAWGYRVELVTEVAKDLTYDKSWKQLANQLLVFAQQDHRLRRLVGEVDWVITDSPLPTGMAYMTGEYETWLPPAIKAAYERYDNHDFWVRRVKPYQTFGRNQTEHQALLLDLDLKDIFNSFTGGLEEMGPEDQVWEIDGDSRAPYIVAKALGLRPQKEKTP